jgi:hypothetical protein
MSLRTRLAKLEKAKPPQAITLSQAIAANDPELTRQFLAQFGIVPSAEVVEDRIERELERRIAEAEGRRLPCGLKVLTPEAQVSEETTHDGQTATSD